VKKVWVLSAAVDKDPANALAYAGVADLAVGDGSYLAESQELAQGESSRMKAWKSNVIG